MRSRRLFAHNTVLSITSRTEKNLPFTPCKLINQGIWGILARAQNLYDISVCHFVFMANHFHMIVVVKDPSHVSPFIGYIKQATAVMINTICGLRQNTVWTDGFDTPVVLTPDKVVERIKYIYHNPTKAHLVNSINDYPGLSSWHMYKNGIKETKHLWLRHSDFYQIDNLHTLSESTQSKIIAKMAGDEPKHLPFTLEPDAWMDCFPEFANINKEEFNKKLIKEILIEEREIQHEHGILGSERLKTQPVNREHKPEKYGKKLLCLSSNIDLRKRYIKLFKQVSQLAYDAYKLIKQGVCNVIFPPGTMMPSGKMLLKLSKAQFCENLGFCYT